MLSSFVRAPDLAAPSRLLKMGSVLMSSVRGTSWETEHRFCTQLDVSAKQMGEVGLDTSQFWKQVPWGKVGFDVLGRKSAARPPGLGSWSL